MIDYKHNPMVTFSLMKPEGGGEGVGGGEMRDRI